MKLTLNKPCPSCYRTVTASELAEKKRRKVLNALNSTTKRIANGTKSGPKQKFNRNEAILLKNKGLSLREIAKLMGVSSSAIHQGLK